MDYYYSSIATGNRLFTYHGWGKTEAVVSVDHPFAVQSICDLRVHPITWTQMMSTAVAVLPTTAVLDASVCLSLSREIWQHFAIICRTAAV